MAERVSREEIERMLTKPRSLVPGESVPNHGVELYYDKNNQVRRKDNNFYWNGNVMVAPNGRIYTV